MAPWIKNSLYALVGVVLATGAFFVFYQVSHANKIMAGVSAAGLDVAGLSQTKTHSIIEAQIEQFANRPINLSYEHQNWSALPAELGINIDADMTTRQAFLIGRQGPWYAKLWHSTKTLWEDNRIGANYTIDEDVLEEYIISHLSDLENPPTNASLQIDRQTVTETPSQTGIMVDREKLEHDLGLIAKNLQGSAISLTRTEAWPILSTDDTETAKLAAVDLLGQGLKLNHLEKTWTLSGNDLIQSIHFIPYHRIGQPVEEEDLYITNSSAEDSGISLKVELAGEKFDIWIEAVAKDLEHPPKNARLKPIDEENLIITLDGDKDPESIQEAELESLSEPGEELDREATASRIFEETNHGQTSIDALVKIAEPEVTADKVRDLGLTHLIARGTSNFSGSPRNRVHNIGVGADKFDSTLIEPGATFSFNDTLGAVDASTGYLPELVIKDHDTIPEYGGGLCQVSTTMFRGAIDAGFPIIERKNHAYAVAYYAPQGTDATIYPGSSDFMFTNDTPGTVLVQTKSEGRILTFDFYGTPDGRLVNKTKPRAYGHFGAGGMKAEWGYTVTISDVILTEQTFTSTYRPPAEFHKTEEEEKKKQEEEENKKKEEEEKKKMQEEDAKKKAEAEKQQIEKIKKEAETKKGKEEKKTETNDQ